MNTMNALKPKQPGRFGTLTIAGILLVIAVLSNFGQEWLVAPTGKLELFGNLGFLLVIGLLWRWRYIGNVVSVLTFLALIALLNSVVLTQFISFGFFLLLIGLSISFYLATFSKAVRGYLNEPTGSVSEN
jgi:hypothetical protein